MTTIAKVSCPPQNIQRLKDVVHVTHEVSESQTYLSLFSSQCLAIHLSLTNVKRETQHVNIALKPCTLAMDYQQRTMNDNLL
jgi:hypothetical protein